MKYLFPLLLTSCISASAAHGAVVVKSTSPDRTFGQHGEVMVSNTSRVVATHCERIQDCYDETLEMCGKGSGFTLIQERWLISKGHEREKGITSYDMYGLYFVIAECK